VISLGAVRASFFSAGTADLSPCSTRRRCAVMRHQPFGCYSVSTSCAVLARERWGFAARFVVVCTTR
jgi:hypothetical protein